MPRVDEATVSIRALRLCAACSALAPFCRLCVRGEQAIAHAARLAVKSLTDRRNGPRP